MTTADLRWTPAPSVSSAPSTPLDDVVDDSYTGRHRKPGARSISVMRMMYRPRHRAR
ncbi:MAG TPA: hypothetical protein VFE40_08255 [Jatrophihabitantaceae bacterium]|nr:hypothetical protein [Jatrophihabitantaceae bacterium]